MNLAFLQAKNCIGNTGTNPPVGCVITNKKNKLIAIGKTSFGGRPHAEINAIRSNKKEIIRKKEFLLLKLLTSKPGKVFKRKEILNIVWASDVVVGDRTIDVHIKKLREKISSDKIKTIKGFGYKFDF